MVADGTETKFDETGMEITNESVPRRCRRTVLFLLGLGNSRTSSSVSSSSSLDAKWVDLKEEPDSSELLLSRCRLLRPLLRDSLSRSESDLPSRRTFRPC